MKTEQDRLRLLEAQVARLERRIHRLEPRSNRYSWTRVLIFLLGAALSIAAFFINWWLCGFLAIATLVAYGIVAHYHGKIENSIIRHTLLQHLMRSYIARITLDWNFIPAAIEGEPVPEHPFEIDLDITGERSVHRLVNTAVSREGSLRLRNWLLHTNPDLTTIRRRQSMVRELAPLVRFRDKLSLRSTLAAHRVAEQLEGNRFAHWLGEPTPAKALLPLLLGTTALNLLTVALLLLAVVLHIPDYWTLSLACAVILLFTTAKQRGDTFEDASTLRYNFAALSSIFNFLETYPYGKQQHLKKLCEPFFQNREESPSRLLKGTARIASAATLEKNRLLWLIVNAFVPWDIYCAYRLRQYKAKIAKRLPVWLDAWFELEALCSLATFAYLHPNYALPDVTCAEEGQVTQPLFEGRDLGHPLIPLDKKVTNSFTMNKLGEIVILTGSNMSGKSTFLRTMGVNLCLAYAGGPVNASHLHTALFRLFTCIRVSDSVTDGYSYFYAEVRRLKALLVELEQKDPLPLFFLVDEIFKGTNNRERLIGSRSYVKTLVGRNCVGFISTHDLELVRLADLLPGVVNYHFREEVIDGQMVFDYVLHPGPCPTTNALKIMQMEGLPVLEEEL